MYDSFLSRLILPSLISFSIPSNWAFAYMANITSYGFTILNREINIGDWLLELEDMTSGSDTIISKKHVTKNTNLNSKVPFEKGMILYNKLRPYLNKVIIADEDGVGTSEIVPFVSFVNPYYFLLFLRSPYFLNRVTNLMYGVKMPRLGTEDARKTIVPLPPANEQIRIVNKIRKIDLSLQGFY